MVNKNNLFIAASIVLDVAFLVTFIYAMSDIQNLKSTIAQNNGNTSGKETRLPATAPKEFQINIVMDDNGFSPTAFQIYGNDKIIVNLMNNGDKPHSFTIDKLGIDITVNPGKTEAVVIDKNLDAQMIQFYSKNDRNENNTFSGSIMILKK